jgi:hypothetical protein
VALTHAHKATGIFSFSYPIRRITNRHWTCTNDSHVCDVLRFLAPGRYRGNDASLYQLGPSRPRRLVPSVYPDGQLHVSQYRNSQIVV